MQRPYEFKLSESWLEYVSYRPIGRKDTVRFDALHKTFDFFVFQNLDGKTKCALFHLSGQHSTFLYNQLFL